MKFMRFLCLFVFYDNYSLVKNALAPALCRFIGFEPQRRFLVSKVTVVMLLLALQQVTGCPIRGAYDVQRTRRIVIVELDRREAEMPIMVRRCKVRALDDITAYARVWCGLTPLGTE